MEFPKSVVLITGGAGALGKAVVRAFVAEGSSLALPVHLPEQAAPLADSLRLPPERVQTGVVDLTNEDAVRSFVRLTEERFGTVHILVNCAGVYAGGKLIEEVTRQEWEGLIQSNLTTAFLMCRAVLPIMRRSGWGRIINISAASSLAPGSRRGPYQVSKRAVITLTETIAEETRGTGITANAIAPTTILTDANRASMPDADTSRWVPPEEIAALAISLCLRTSSSVTGNTIRM